MMVIPKKVVVPLVALLLAALQGCGSDEPRLAGTPPDTTPPLGEVAGSATVPATVDRGVLVREADELDRHVLQLRAHIATMRQLSPTMALALMPEHAAHVEAVAERIAAQRANLPVPDAQLPMLMGVGADEYGVMLEEVRAAHAELMEMRRGDEALVRERFPGHLDRLERLAGQLEHIAAGLRR
jgi:hypothetical protein